MKTPAFFARLFLVMSLMMGAAVVRAQAPAVDTPPAPPTAPPQSAKKELVARVLKLQQPGIEALVRAMTEEPAVVLVQRAAQVMATRIPKERQQALGKSIEADVQKYLGETVQPVRTRALELAPLTVGPLLESRFSEDELRQIAAVLESPVFARFQQMGGDMQRALQGRLVADTRALVDPRVQALEKAISDRLTAAVQAAANVPSPPMAPPVAPVRPAAKPAVR
jgi:uncharacterized protein